jgi:GT2 family glycosyltransferase
MRLTDVGRRQALALLAAKGTDTAQGLVEPLLRRRLVNAGMLPPAPPAPGRPLPTFGFVIPHFNDPEAAADSVMMLISACSEIPDLNPAGPSMVVVDDGSDPAARQLLHRLLEPLSPGISVLDQPINSGPGAARNAGAAALDADVIVFVDCGVTLATGALGQLIRWLIDGASIAAAAPRIRPSIENRAISRYERVRSPLDVAGDITEPTLVGSARTISYVPSTVLAVRSEAFRTIGGFDDSLRYGEDVDLIWRLEGSEQQVVLDPTIVAEHPARATVAEFAAQRFRYGTSAGPLERRHGAKVAPAVLRPQLALAALAFLFAPVRTAAALFVVSLAGDATLRSRRFDQATGGLPGGAALGAVESARFNTACSVSFVFAMSRPWWPLTSLLIAQPWSSRLRRRAAVAVVAQLLHRARAVGVTTAPLGVVDDLAYSSGVWLSAARERRCAALLPRLLRGR